MARLENLRIETLSDREFLLVVADHTQDDGWADSLDIAMSWASDPERYALGAQRLESFIQAQAQLHGEAMSLTMSLGYAGAAGYSDEALNAIETDARDVITAAHALADNARRLAREWRDQALESEP